MRRIRRMAIAAVALAALVWVAIALLTEQRGSAPWPAALTGHVSYEAWARAQFERRHPGEKPLNWAVAQAAVRFHRERPMGRFVLGLTPGKYGNDCSDFVDCAVDEGLGVKARFRRGSAHHLLADRRALYDSFPWHPGVATQPGDVVAVRHSPWYEPSEQSCWHVGIIGSDGMVYDFVKLRRWSEARYGRTSFEWFVAHSSGPGEVTVARLRAAVRYRIVDVSRLAAGRAGGDAAHPSRP